MIIRRATVKDIDDILEIEHQSFDDPWNAVFFLEELESKASIVNVVIHNNETIGFIIARYLLDEGHILNFAVLKKYRNCGVAAKLLNETELTFKNLTVLNLFLEVRNSNTQAISFYKKHGFFQIDIRKNYYTDPNEDAIIMQKSLN